MLLLMNGNYSNHNIQTRHYLEHNLDKIKQLTGLSESQIKRLYTTEYKDLSPEDKIVKSMIDSYLAKNSIEKSELDRYEKDIDNKKKDINDIKKIMNDKNNTSDLKQKIDKLSPKQKQEFKSKLSKAENEIEQNKKDVTLLRQQESDLKNNLNQAWI